MAKAVFSRKPNDINDLKPTVEKPGEGNQFLIEEIVELTNAEYDSFSSNLLDDYPFIEQNIHAMYIDNLGIYHCIYVKAEDSKEGILVESEGYSYARYAAYHTELGCLTEKIKNQILSIRASGKYNMFDKYGVQREAYEKEYFELVVFLEFQLKEYIEFILYGNR